MDHQPLVIYDKKFNMENLNSYTSKILSNEIEPDENVILFLAHLHYEGNPMFVQDYQDDTIQDYQDDTIQYLMITCLNPISDWIGKNFQKACILYIHGIKNGHTRLFRYLIDICFLENNFDAFYECAVKYHQVDDICDYVSNLLDHIHDNFILEKTIHDLFEIELAKNKLEYLDSIYKIAKSTGKYDYLIRFIIDYSDPLQKNILKNAHIPIFKYVQWHPKLHSYWNFVIKKNEIDKTIQTLLLISKHRNSCQINTRSFVKNIALVVIKIYCEMNWAPPIKSQYDSWDIDYCNQCGSLYTWDFGSEHSHERYCGQCGCKFCGKENCKSCCW